MALTPEQMEQLRRAGYLRSDGRMLMSTGTSGAGMAQEGEGGGGAGAYNPLDPVSNYFGGYQSYDAAGLDGFEKMGYEEAGKAMKGRTFGAYGADNQHLGDGVNTWGGLDPIVKMGPYIMAALATMGVGSTIAGAAGAAAGAGGAGAAGAMGPITAAEAAAQSAALHSSLAPYAAGAGGAGSGLLGTMDKLPLMDPSIAGSALSEFAPSAAMSSAIGALPAAGSSLLPGAKGVSSLLGTVAPILGGIAGGQDQPGQTSSRDLPEWLKPYVTDMMGKTQGLLNQQMPIAQQQATGLLDKGNSLMNINPAGNGFGMFTRGRYGQ